MSHQDAVNHPSHYNQGKIEVIEFIEDQHLGFHLGNAIKYISRAGKKDPAKLREDLAKAIWYTKRLVELLTAAQEGRPPVRPNEMNEKDKRQPAPEKAGPGLDTPARYPREAMTKANREGCPEGAELAQAKCGHVVRSGWRCRECFYVCERCGQFVHVSRGCTCEVGK